MIDLKKFELISPKRRLGVRAREIEIFLKNNKNNAYTITEILDYLKKEFGWDLSKKISGMLRTLEKLEIVEHKSPYWKIKERSLFKTSKKVKK